MKSMGASQAKTALVRSFGAGKERRKIAITRHGVPAAVLVPATGAAPRLMHKEVVAGMRALRKRVKPGKTRVRNMVKEGRQF